jgi:hypothetical protein
MMVRHSSDSRTLCCLTVSGEQLNYQENGTTAASLQRVVRRYLFAYASVSIEVPVYNAPRVEK